MLYQGKHIEILTKKKIFGKSIAQIRILSTGEILDVPEAELSQHNGQLSGSEITFRAVAIRIKSEVNKQKMLSPFESNVIPLPHQILALEKIMSGQFMRFLIADEVGMGKTIEAGLVLKELKLRGIVGRTLVVVPKSAMLQWKQEMKKHFNETFHIYDSELINTLTRTFTLLDADNEINIWSQHNQLIVSMDALKPIESRQGWTKEKVEEYNKYRIQSVLDADFDLLIIDECHKVGGSTLTVGRHQMADILCNAIPNVLLLSATPHRGKSDHFRRILQLLDSDAFAGEGMPPITELEPYVVRTEKRQAIDYNGKQLFSKRNTATVEVTYHPQRHKKQKNLYDSVTEYVINGFNLAQQTKNTSYGFVMLLFQRMMSSSTNAILNAMEKRAARLASEKGEVNKENIIANFNEIGYDGQFELDFEAKVLTIVEETKANYETELVTLKGLIKSAKDCLNTESDAKVDYLLDKLTELKKKEDNPELKFLIFTEFTATQFMLKKVLEEKGGYVCEHINGSMEFEERVNALRNFKGNTQVLVSTDAAGESLNMQFAYIVINYDMPWNPMIVEQRIGRVDRIGQTKKVLALNLLLDNSIDKRVYEVVETKLNQIMKELGIDKTSDVLDSTMERDSINKLYLTSLLSPEKFEKESQNWLNEIRNKLKDYKSTEGALPTLDSKSITTDKTDGVKYSPLPTWLEIMVTSHLKSKGITYNNLLDGIRFTFPGFKEQIYTFNIKESINNPIPEPISLQHEIIQTILSEAVPVDENQPIPVVKIESMPNVNGVWSLWQLIVKNRYEEQQFVAPIFVSSQGDYFPAFADDVWQKISTDSNNLTVKELLLPPEVKPIFDKQVEIVEGILNEKYYELETLLITNTNRIQQNKEKAFDFQLKQLNKIGIENIKQSRIQKLEKEKYKWIVSHELQKEIIPDLKCFLILKFADE
ncbi:MAG: DEAD/DEAH box helicase [Prolixibacteraceae bacterium]|jgi:superfamily II DNA or RNA helicase|nr:DEAD/DEAH box helicase [Prolixibacteraceae bacterium]